MTTYAEQLFNDIAADPIAKLQGIVDEKQPEGEVAIHSMKSALRDFRGSIIT